MRPDRREALIGGALRLHREAGLQECCHQYSCYVNGVDRSPLPMQPHGGVGVLGVSCREGSYLPHDYGLSLPKSRYFQCWHGYVRSLVQDPFLYPWQDAALIARLFSLQLPCAIRQGPSTQILWRRYVPDTVAILGFGT